MTNDSISEATITREQFREAMGLFPGAVTLITAGEGTARRGLTATAVCSLTDSPPSLLVCVNAGTETCTAIRETGKFSVQLLSDEAEGLALHFAGAKGARGAEKFREGAWETCGSGLPRLGSALASIACEVTSDSLNGSHRVFIGKITDVRLAPERGALVYARSKFHALAAE